MVELTAAHRSWIIAILIAINGGYLLWKHRGKQDFFGFDVPDVICFSPKRIAIPFEQLSISTLLILFICVSSHFLRMGIERQVTDSLVRILLQEAVAAADLCGCCFELIIVADNFGVWIYGLYLFLLSIWWSKDWGEANASPNSQIEDVLLGKQDSQLSLTKIWAQLTGGIFVFKLMQYVWSLELMENHEKRAFEDCTADLQVSIWQGFLIECGGTFVCHLASKLIADIEPRYGTVMESFVGTSMVVAAFDRTGGYFNPALATALKFGCEGNTLREHVFVYWMGSSLGAVLSFLLYHRTPFKTFVQNGFRSKKLRTEPENNGIWDKSD